MSSDPLLSVRGLKKHYPIRTGILKREVGRVRAVDGIDVDVDRGQIFGLVGESGCGKSTVAQTVLRLEEPTAGSIRFDGEEVTEYDSDELRRFRRRAQIIFQDPDSSFDPRMSVGESVGEPLRVQGLRDRDRRRRIVGDLLERVGLSSDDARRYPHEFSGGQKQRIALARALSVNPDLIIADEPVSALDVSTKAEILRLIADLQSAFDLSIVLISHDISVVEQICDRVAVMYLGNVVERGPTASLLAEPQHPYTESLLASVPTPDPNRRGDVVELRGDVPSPSDPPPGCRFHTRCPKVIQPPEYDLDQDAWRRVVAFRERLRTADADDADDLEATAVRAAQAVDAEDTSSSVAEDRETKADGAPSGESLTAAQQSAVRNALELPASLGDSRADAELSSAIDHVRAGEVDRAHAVLAETFTSPCDRETPAFWNVGENHQAACHLRAETADNETATTEECQAETET